MDLTQQERKAPHHQHDAYYNMEKVLNLMENVYPVLNGIYFRSQLIHFEKIPERNHPEHPLIYISNHSGMCFPWDAMIFGAAWLKKAPTDKQLRPLVAPMLTATNLMNPYMLENFWEEMGGLRASYRNFESMMNHPQADLLIYPEGVPGIGKGFNRKYQLQRLATSSVRMSIKYRTEIIPFATINAEYLNPYSYSFDGINRFSKRIGIPFLPIGFFIFLIPFQPWIFYFSLPAKLTYIRGKAIRPFEWIDKPYEEISQKEIEHIRDRIHEQLQADILEGEKLYGQHPYQWKELFTKMWQQRKHFPFFIPFSWPFMFLEFERQYRKTQQPNVKLSLNFLGFLKMLIMNPLGWCYFIPIIGWIPLLIRGYRQKRKLKR